MTHIESLITLSLLLTPLACFCENAPWLTESERKIPVAHEVDVVVVGGGVAGVAAAVEAAQQGASVFLMAPRTFLGEDICGTYRLWLEKDETPATPLARAVYADAPAMPSPAHVKRTLEDALISAKVKFLFSCFPSDLLRDADGKPSGVVMANRAGRQAVIAKVIIDATPRASVARMAGAEVSPYPSGEQVFQRVVVGGDIAQAPSLTGRKVEATAEGGAPIIEYTLRLPMKDGRFSSFAAAEQAARDLTFHPAQLDASECLFQVPPDSLRGVRQAAGGWKGAAALDLDAFRPSNIQHLYVAGGCADLARDTAAKMLRPAALMELGARIGNAAAVDAGKRSPVKTPGVAADKQNHQTTATGEVREFLAGPRPTGRPADAVPSPSRSLPVLGTYDVVVVGGGTAGAPAGIAAGRAGARTLILEQHYSLGGVATLGLINKYYHGFRGGFTKEVDSGVSALKAVNSAIGKAEWWRTENRKAGTEIWFGTLGCGTVVEKDTVIGVVVATPDGRGIVRARTVIDATGSADVAAAAGAPCMVLEGDEPAVQGSGLPPVKLGAHYTNTDWTFADDTDVVDFWHHYILARHKFPTAYDISPLLDTRERRRIIGDVVITPMDIILKRTWPDTLVHCMSNFDSHGFTVHPIFFAMPPDQAGLSVFVPFRAMLPRGMDGILVTGLGASAHRDAMPVIRMQPDVQNQGYACGRAAAMVAKKDTTIRRVDIHELQKHLVEKGCLPEQVLADKDSFPPDKETVALAVRDLAAPSGAKTKVNSAVKNRAALATVFAQPKEAVPLLEKACASASGEAKLAYAHVLAMLGSNAGLDALLEKVASANDFDKGWNYKGMGQFGRSVSELDAYIISLGRIGDTRAVDVILDKVRLLDASREFSHHRACALALERLKDTRAAGPLAEVLAKPGMTGHATTTLETAIETVRPSSTDNTQRNESLRELVLARALYRCGDKNGLGEKILRDYSRDLRGLYARHAQSVLNGK